MLPLGLFASVIGTQNILNGVTANNTKQNTLDIEKLNERLNKLGDRSLALQKNIA